MNFSMAETFIPIKTRCNMKENKKTNLFWEYLYMLLITATISLLPLLYYQALVPVMLLILLSTLALIIVIWRKPMSKSLLYLLNLLNVIAVGSFAFFILLILRNTPESIISLIIVIVLLDVYSFTKRGKNTLNAKLIAQPTALARLSFCLPVPGKPGLQPIIGVGDLYFYSVMALFALDTYNILSYFIVVIILITGQLSNILFIYYIKDKSWYKGFPATLFPGLLYLVLLISGIIK